MILTLDWNPEIEQGLSPGTSASEDAAKVTNPGRVPSHLAGIPIYTATRFDFA